MASRQPAAGRGAQRRRAGDLAAESAAGARRKLLHMRYEDLCRHAPVTTGSRNTRIIST